MKSKKVTRVKCCLVVDRALSLARPSSRDMLENIPPRLATAIRERRSPLLPLKVVSSSKR